MFKRASTHSNATHILATKPNDINQYSIYDILDKMIKGELPLSTFSEFHQGEEREDVKESVLIKSLYMEKSFRQEVFNLIKKANLDKASIEHNSEAGWNSYKIAIFTGQVEIAQYLLKQIDNYTLYQPRSYSLLNLAILSQSMDMIKLISRHYDQNYFHLDKQHKDLMTHAVETENKAIIEYMSEFYSKEHLLKIAQGPLFDDSQFADPFNPSQTYDEDIKNFILTLIEKRELESSVDIGKNAQKQKI